MNRKTKIIISVSTVLAIVVLGFACSIFYHAMLFWRGTKGTPTLDKLKSCSGIQFPQDTRLVKGYFEGFQDPQYLAVLEFDAKDTETFVKGIPRNPNQFGQTRISRTDRLPITNGWPDINRDKSHSWWNPDSVHKFIAVEIPWGSTQVYLLISLDDAARTRVYMYIVTS